MLTILTIPSDFLYDSISMPLMPPKKPNMSEEDAFSANAATVRAWRTGEAPGNTASMNRTFSSSDGKQHSMLYRACRFGHFEVARLLVEDFGADVNVQPPVYSCRHSEG